MVYWWVVFEYQLLTTFDAPMKNRTDIDLVESWFSQSLRFLCPIIHEPFGRFRFRGLKHNIHLFQFMVQTDAFPIVFRWFPVDVPLGAADPLHPADLRCAPAAPKKPPAFLVAAASAEGQSWKSLAQIWGINLNCVDSEGVQLSFMKMSQFSPILRESYTWIPMSMEFSICPPCCGCHLEESSSLWLRINLIEKNYSN